jgi:membrane-bound lytic murein transglycosylase D
MADSSFNPSMSPNGLDPGLAFVLQFYGAGRGSFPTLGYLLALAVLVFSGCASRIGAEQVTLPAPEDPPGPTGSLALTELTDHACSLFEHGRQLWNQGLFEEGRHHLDDALFAVQEALLQSNSPVLIALWAELSQQTVALVDATQLPNQDPLYDEAALERLLEGELFEFNFSELVDGQAVEQEEFSQFPRVKNAVVDGFLRVFTGSKRAVIAAGLERSGRFLPQIRHIFLEQGLPAELAFLPLIESGFQVRARSKAGALGMWQFMEGTAGDFGLAVNWWEDQRLDPLLSTKAAASYLQMLHREFGDWYLALAAYNAGPGRIRSALRRSGLRDFWALARARALPRETMGYVPAFLAALSLCENPSLYGFDPPRFASLEFENIAVPYSVDLAVLARASGLARETLLDLNPSLLQKAVPPDRLPFTLRVPPGRGTEILATLAQIPEKDRIAFSRYRVREGDTFASIARSHRLPLSHLIQANPGVSPRRLRIGQILVLPVFGKRQNQVVADQPRQHRVRKGDTLSAIAQRYGVPLRRLQELNPQALTKLLPGMVLLLAAAPPAGGL